jgi:hypothetical protein
MPIVVEVAPWGLLSPLAYVVDSIRFLDSTPPSCQRQRPGRTPEKMTSPTGGLGLRREAEGGSYLTEATGFPFIRARTRARARNVIWGRYAFDVEESGALSPGQRTRSCPRWSRSGYVLRAARHDMHSPDGGFAEPQTDAGSQRADSSCLRPPGLPFRLSPGRNVLRVEVENDGGPTGFILRGIVDWDDGSCC